MRLSMFPEGRCAAMSPLHSMRLMNRKLVLVNRPFVCWLPDGARRLAIRIFILTLTNVFVPILRDNAY
ncbi:hypothetical protein C0V82_23230 (plasmid) [Niveispirillum cyanobacteriorum]|uniref:Uncharacterized protein n=1 Tax=Niveispirillum cyanobacteriorum TaxID=1612173 RepID=A0A2K9NJM6_9PROT|nr:hypothetical protein C0V82_23230 [Niveispirillum cyanobacteriorum]